MSSDFQQIRVGSLLLDDDRIVNEAGKQTFQIALLEDIEGINVGFQHRPIFLLFGLASAATLGLVAFDAGADIGASGLLGLATFVLFLFAYFSSRQSAITVHAGNLAMKSVVRGGQLEAARNFAWNVMCEKRTRLANPRSR